jgi:polyphosphate kinase
MASFAASRSEWEVAPGQPTRFLNRELSWLDFDDRVLELAADARLPLLERVKLCSIASSNLDEFFAVRMARLHQSARRGDRRRPAGRENPAATLAGARKTICGLQAEQDRLWLDELRPALAAEGIRIAAPDDCAPPELRALSQMFDREIGPLLTPLALGAWTRFPALHSLALNIAVTVNDEQADERRLVLIHVPSDAPRFLELGLHGIRVPLEEAVLYFLPTILGHTKVEAATVFRVTRDAEVSVDRDPDDALEAVDRQLLQRRLGDVVRLEVERTASCETVETLRLGLGIDPLWVYETGAPLGLRDLSQLANIDRPELKYLGWRPRTERTFPERSPDAVLKDIGQRDVLVHHPYDSFESSVQAFVDAARDASVAALKATVYRTGAVSPTISSLLKTAQEEKQGVALIELRARFDERCNIGWARRLERAGVNVVYGRSGMKMHAKLALIVRREGGQLRRYAHIGTGNYHVSNASVYEDLSLFTADEEIAADVADVFNAITGNVEPTSFRKLLVGPWFLRDGLLREIHRTAAAAARGDRARIRIKCNSLVDAGIIDALYAASAAGVAVEIIVRGICALRPRAAGLSDRITVHSVLGRFLEHSRILIFEMGEKTTTWIGSADLMPRNLDRRLEVLAPVEDPRLQAEIAKIFAALLSDTHASWALHADGRWRRRRPHDGALAVSAQETLMARAREAAGSADESETLQAVRRRAA